MLEEWDFVEVPPEPVEPVVATATELVAGDLTATTVEDDGFGRPGILIHVESTDMNIMVSRYDKRLVHITTYGPDHLATVANLFSGRADLGARRHYIALKPR